jgi:two-component system, chemotaxis family, chemotaxis protein CheY
MMQHCLIVDDSDIVRRYTRLIFESMGFRVIEASNSKEALERLAKESPDYVLVDWRIPGENMIDFVAWVRQMPLQKRPHIMYLTTENEGIEIERALNAGADSFLLKPFNLEIIEMKLQEIRLAA